MHPHPLAFRLFSLLKPAAMALVAACVLQGGVLQAAPAWETVKQENGVDYIPMDTLRSFYKFTASGWNRDRVQVSYGGFPIVFFPGTTRVLIGGYQCHLVHPILRQPNGDLLISQTDVVKLFDPVLRPTYITPRRTVGTVIIDPGHGGADTGVSANGVNEADLTLKIALALKAELVKRHYTVLLTRDGNVTASDQRRLECLAQAQSPVFISIHANSGRSDISGVETYCLQPAGSKGPTRPGNACDAENIALAFSLHTALVSSTGAEDRSCRRVRYSFLSSVPCPAAIVEVGYPTNKEEADRLCTDDYRRKIAAALADGVCTFDKALRPDVAIPPATTPEVLADTDVPPLPVQEAEPATSKPEAKPASKPSTKPAAKPSTKPAAKPASKPAAKPATKPSAKPASGKKKNGR